MPSVPLDLNRLSAQVYDLAVLSESTDVECINVNELINVEDHLVEALAYVRSLQNTFSPLNRLPPEVLANIISFLQPDLPTFSPFPLPPTFHAWAESLMVCRHWRRTAISTPSLWDRIHLDDDSAERAAVWFSRSQDVPFKFYYTGSFPWELTDSTQPSILSDVFTQVSRLQELHVSSTWARDGAFWGLLDRPAPIMESLSWDVKGPGAILPCIFKDDMPRLKSVALSNVSSWPHNRFCNLTRFSLRDQPETCRPSLSEFIAFLSGSPNLQELVLVGAGPTGDNQEDLEDVDKSTPVAVLQSLRHLEIGSFCQNSTYSKHLRMLLKHLDMPTTTIRCFWEKQPYISPAKYFIQREQDEEILLRDAKKIVMTSYSTKSNHFVGFKNSTLYANFVHSTPFLGLPSNMPLLANIEELTYAPASSWETGYFRVLLQSLPSLRIIKISGELWLRPYQVCEALLELNRPSSGAKTRFKYAPKLEELHIYPPDEENGVQSDEGVDVLIMVINVRANNGHPLRAIKVDQFRDESVQQLQEYLDGIVLCGEGYATGFSRDDVLSGFGVSIVDPSSC